MPVQLPAHNGGNLLLIVCVSVCVYLYVHIYIYLHMRSYACVKHEVSGLRSSSKMITDFDDLY